MYVQVTDGVAGVHEAEDLTSLEVRAGTGQEAGVDAALRAAGLGTWDGGPEAQLDVGRLRELAAADATAPDWATGWDAMITYATRKGWVPADGTSVRAHLTGS